MHYKLKGIEIRTENAAKPYRQRGKWLLKQISCIATDAAVLDYGCGKFRYTIPLSRRVRKVCAVDSLYQIDREQRIANRRTHLREYAAKHLKNVSVDEVDSGGWRQRRFDFILCANVLSVIPHRPDRIKVLRHLRGVLKSGGLVLVSTQFRNTYFQQWETNPNATRVLDGWFVQGMRGASFYAIIPPKRLAELCRAAGLEVTQVGSKGETAFVFAARVLKRAPNIRSRAARPVPATARISRVSLSHV